MSQQLKECDRIELAIAAGGTAGHINPALALADEMTSRGHSVTFFGQRDRLEGKLVPRAGYDLHEIEVSGFDRTEPWTLVPAIANMWRAFRNLRPEFDSLDGPDVAIGFGAYVEMPLLMRCWQDGTPYLIHEQNSVPGLANKLVARGASLVALSMPSAREPFTKLGISEGNIVVTGNPVRSAITQASREAGRRHYGIADDETLLLVFGGSLGARHVNEAIAQLKRMILKRDKVRIVHSTGESLYDEVIDSLSLTDEERKRWQVVPYINDMGEALMAADLVVSRAGASSVAEISAVAVPSILVPYPLATGDHQTTNAKSLVDSGAALLVPDDQLDKVLFKRAVLDTLDDPQRREQMREVARKLGHGMAAKKLADQIEIAVGQR